MIYYQSKLHRIQGQSLIEALFAMSLAVVSISTVAYLIFQTQVSVRQSTEQVQAQELAQEGLAAVTSISQNSFDSLSVGTHGLAVTDGVWGFSGSVDTSGKYTRTVVITTVDEQTYLVVSTVTWDITAARTGTVSYTTYVSNWEQTADDAAYLYFDTSAVLYASGGTSIEGITVANTQSSANLTITQLSAEWDGGAKLSGVSIDGLVVYSATTSEAAVSGELVDTIDILIGSDGVPVTFGPLLFTSDMRATDVLITTYLSDGSKRYTRVQS
ncbi:MAG: Tfp pilus assembly protein PilV [Acidimicrobiales bacterium]|jgi:Tfp pilus assembly protein PilV